MTSKWTPDSLPSLKGKVYLITGGNTGIGRATVAGLSLKGAKVYMGARSESRAQAAIDEIKNEISTANIHFLEIDLTSFSSVIAAANRIKSHEKELHGLINNAGIMGVPFELTGDGYDLQWQVNYLSHWLLTHHLLPLLLSTTTSAKKGGVRIVNISSVGHARFAPDGGIRFDNTNLETESGMTRYGQSKLANVLHAKELHRRYGGLGEGQPEIWTAAVHPGNIDTNLNRQATSIAPAPVLKIVAPVMACLGILDKQDKGSWSSLYAAASNEFNSSGAYVIPYARIGNPSALAQDPKLAAQLWSYTEQVFREKDLLS